MEEQSEDLLAQFLAPDAPEDDDTAVSDHQGDDDYYHGHDDSEQDSNGNGEQSGHDHAW